jgi:hypothetical protein
MKHSIKPYSKDISEVQREFFKSTKDYLILVWYIIKRKIKSTRRSKNLRISCEQNKNRNIPIIVEEQRWDAFRGIPKLRHLSLLEYLLGVPWASPRLNYCLSLFFSYRYLLDLRTLHPHKT